MSLFPHSFLHPKFAYFRLDQLEECFKCSDRFFVGSEWNVARQFRNILVYVTGQSHTCEFMYATIEVHYCKSVDDSVKHISSPQLRRLLTSQEMVALLQLLAFALLSGDQMNLFVAAASPSEVLNFAAVRMVKCTLRVNKETR